MKEYDVAVLGGGPAGYPAAIRASQLGARVCLVEKEKLGGVCLNRGCIPTKTMHGLAHLIELAGSGGEAGVSGSIKPDIAGLMGHKSRVVDGLVTGVEKILKGRKVDVIRGTGRITSPGVIDVKGVESITAANIIIATGSSEIELPGMEFDGRNILSSTDLLEIDRIPESMIVVGGGVIGCEFASIFNAFGTKVSIVEMLPSLVTSEDIHVIRFLQTYFRKKGIGLNLGKKVSSLEVKDGAVISALDDGSQLNAEVALVSIGRRPNIEGTGAVEAGVETTGDGIVVNGKMETGVNGIYAAGDVIGGYLLAHVATREGLIAAENALGASREIDYKTVPTTIYTLPEVSHVGMTSQEAKEAGIETVEGRFPFAANGKAKGLREEEGFVKWIADASDKRLLGLHILGPQATELLPAGILAIDRKMTAEEFTSVILPHPTLGEALGEAAEALEGKAIHMLR
ncbi:MAG: dihydrolipoyl dehydrogenase [Bacteroidales bacterium]|nr:dihydrolipoyl dehydrogenase [Candidatus Latescibacterota bacterium]